MFTACLDAGRMSFYQGKIIHDNTQINKYTLKLEEAKSAQDSIKENIEFAKTNMSNAAESLQNQNTYFLELGVNDASKNLSNAKAFYEELQKNGASDSEVEKAKAHVDFCTDVLNSKKKELTEAENENKALVETSKALSNQYFEKLEKEELKVAQATEKKCTTETTKWQGDLEIHKAGYNSAKESFEASVQDEFSVKLGKG